jgi:hypothetical protein
VAGKRGKSGRRRKQRKRTPAGQVSRAKAHLEQAEDVRRVALDARMQMLGLPEAWAVDQRAGSVFGCLAIQWVLDKHAEVPRLRRRGVSPDFYEAGLRWLDLQHAYRRSLDAPGLPRHPRGEVTKACAECGREQLCDPCLTRSVRSIQKAYVKAAEAVLEVAERVRSIKPVKALDLMVAKDDYDEALVDALNLALEALHRHFLGQEPRK